MAPSSNRNPIDCYEKWRQEKKFKKNDCYKKVGRGPKNTHRGIYLLL